MPPTKVSTACQNRRAKSHDQNLSWCGGCSKVYCDRCYDLQAAHDWDEDEMPDPKHKKTDLQLVMLINSIFEISDSDQGILHSENEVTKWFGVERNNGKATLEDYGRFAQLAGGSQMEPQKQFPCLISFIGETGAGKSTVINGLVKMGTNDFSLNNQTFPTPVPGSHSNIDTATSSNVHLFADPETYHSIRPLFYADCEGLRGGENAPVAERFRVREKLGNATRITSRHREITYAQPTYTRPWFVKNLYPRILFPFSDVICYVTKNSRAIMDIIQSMVTWADAVMEKSLNQPMLPHAIIIVNAVSEGVRNERTPNTDWWDIKQTTTRALAMGTKLIQPNPGSGSSVGVIATLAEQWRKRGKNIESLQDFMDCYFSSFKVIYIPTVNFSPATWRQQYMKLQLAIQESSIESLQKRKSKGFLMSAADFEFYLDFAFDHFRTNTNDPFNFATAVSFLNPVPMEFKNHVPKLVEYIMAHEPQKSGKDLFVMIAPLVASSIFLHAHRSRLPGRGVAKNIYNCYAKDIMDAHEEFYQKYWTCERKDRHGLRCVNAKSGHTKGHQNAKGKIFATGEFESSFEKNPKREQKRFLDAVLAHLENPIKELELLKGSEASIPDEEKAAARVHVTRTLTSGPFAMLWSIDPDGKKPPMTRMTCFACFAFIPEHTLSCGHIICHRCVENNSNTQITLNTQNRFYHTLEFCPLCRQFVKYKIKATQPEEGLRILCLDGGGMRSIIQLEILKSLELTIGLGVPIQDFFDLIIGTSGGGIVAFGIGLKHWSVTKCIDVFKEVARKAFTKRTGVDWHTIGTLIQARHHSIYKTRTLEEALQEVFGCDEPLFGGKPNVDDYDLPPAVKVGVTATSSGNQAYLLSNYNRQPPKDKTHLVDDYTFWRGENPKFELKIWEALRATSAAPMYFKSFYHPATRQTFNDGGIKFNNPAMLANQERKTLWPDLANRDPDLFLSIGTGFSPTRMSKFCKPGPIAVPGVEGFVRRMFKIANDIIQSTTNCEARWKYFMTTLNIGPRDEERRQKYQRLNLKLATLPELDDVAEMDDLAKSTECNFPPNSQVLSRIAKTLIATLFSFEVKCFRKTEEGDHLCEGQILCRLPPREQSLRNLCTKLLDCQVSMAQDGSTKSVFVVGESKNYREPTFAEPLLEVSKRVTWGQPYIQKFSFLLEDSTKFDDISVYLLLSDGAETPISGFPRTIYRESMIRTPTTIRRPVSASI